MFARALNRRITIPLLVVLATSAGCSSRAAFYYTPGVPVTTSAPPLPLRVAVLPFEDLRGDRNTDAALLYLIPLMPFSWINYDRPDGANGFLFHDSYNFRPPEDLAHAAVTELQQDKFFEEVFFTERAHEPNVDLVLTGQIDEARYDAKVISYGLSVEGPLLWLFGFPAGTTHNGLRLTITLRRARDAQSPPLWSYTITGDWGATVGCYYNWGADFDGMPLILKNGLHNAMSDLATQLQSKPSTYWH
jgi:hypothetical protein